MRNLTNKLLLFLLLGFLTWLGLSAYSSVAAFIDMSRDIEAYKDRAQVSANVIEMAYWLEQLEANMEAKGMREGYASIFVQSPYTDMAEVRKNINIIQERAISISLMDTQSDAYQQGLDDLRGTLREVNLHAFGWWLYQGGGWIWVLVGLPLSSIGALTIGIRARIRWMVKD